ncbi:MAG: DUF4340 domain-containing protein [Pseudomonadota bacterium]
MNKLNQALIALLCFQVVLISCIFLPQMQKKADSGPGDIFPGVKQQEIVSLNIEDNSSKHVEIKKGDSGWMLPGLDGYPAVENKVSSFLSKLTELKTKPLVARNKSSHTRLKVSEKDFERRIIFQTVKGKEPYTLYMGSSSGTNTAHVRAGSEKEVYLAKDIAIWEAGVEPAAWIDTLYFSVNEEDITRISITNSKGVLVFKRGEQKEWIFEEPKQELKLKVEEWQEMVHKAASIRLNEPVGREEKDSFGMKSPVAVITLTTSTALENKEPAKDGEDKASQKKVEKTYTITIGAESKEKGGNFIVKSSESQFYVMVETNLLKDLVEKGIKDITGPAEKPQEIGAEERGDGKQQP